MSITYEAIKTLTAQLYDRSLRGIPGDTRSALERADQPVEGDNLLAALDHGQDDAVETGADGLPTGRLYRVGRRWPVAWTREPRRLANSLAGNAGCVKVTYTAGFAANAPADVIAACYQDAAARYLRRAGIGAQTSVSMDGYAKTYGPVSGSDPLASGTPTGPFVTADLKSALLSYRVPAIA